MQRFGNHVGILQKDVTSHIDKVFSDDLDQKANDAVKNQSRSFLVKTQLSNVKKQIQLSLKKRHTKQKKEI